MLIIRSWQLIAKVWSWPTADFRQPEKSISLYRPFRVLNF